VPGSSDRVGKSRKPAHDIWTGCGFVENVAQTGYTAKGYTLPVIRGAAPAGAGRDAGDIMAGMHFGAAILG
jgi:hypothetical protein